MFIYAFTVFLSAFLLFLVQPMIAKYILPWFGGTPAMWSTCMLFFQMLLLGGYFYAHSISSRLRPRTHAIVHIAIIGTSLVLLVVSGIIWESPITPGSEWKTGGSEMPVLNIILLLLISVGVPFFILSTTGPLVQRWFYLQYPERSTYRLYSLSNLGSLIGLLSYPFIIEPALRLSTQTWIWSIMFLVFGLSCAYLAHRAGKVPAANSSIDTVKYAERNLSESTACCRPRLGLKVLWILLAAGASSMLLAVTNQMCQEVAVIPFLWILPLSLYLITFIICFGHEKLYTRWYVAVFILAAYLLYYTIEARSNLHIPQQLKAYSFGLFMFCLLCHGELTRSKPHPKFLTTFYLCVSIGGAAGGIFVALVAPWVFSGYWELHSAIVFCFIIVLYSMLRDSSSWVHSQGKALSFFLMATGLAAVFHALYKHILVHTFVDEIWNWYIGVLLLLLAFLYDRFRRRGSFFSRRMGVLGFAVLAGVLSLYSLQLFFNFQKTRRDILYSARNFFGVLRVSKGVAVDKDGGHHEYFDLLHGTVIHGRQFVEAERRNEPLSYYSVDTGVAQILNCHPKKQCNEKEELRIGVVGLGVGSLAAYAREEDYLSFYEINPEVVSLAWGKGGFFSYLEDCPAQLDIVLGDGRLSLERQLTERGSMQFDVLVLDAFAGDTIPVHLLVKEAFETYLEHLTPDGVICINVSNIYLKLDPLISKMAEHFGCETIFTQTHGTEVGYTSASWMLMSRNKEIFEIKEIAQKAERKEEDLDKYSIWTDDYSNLFQYLK